MDSRDGPWKRSPCAKRRGAGFGPRTFWGSRAITGAIGPTDADKTVGYDDKTMSDTMRAIGLQPERIGEAARHDIENFIELHIEQGPVLEHADLPVAVVTGITGLRHYEVELTQASPTTPAPFQWT